MNSPMQVPPFSAPTLDTLHLPQGKRTRLHHMLYGHGPGNGTMMVLPLDQGLEHGPTDFFPLPPAGDPDYQFELAEAGGFLPSRWALAWPKNTWPAMPARSR